jgi:hypothetical protein
VVIQNINASPCMTSQFCVVCLDSSSIRELLSCGFVSLFSSSYKSCPIEFHNTVFNRRLFLVQTFDFSNYSCHYAIRIFLYL